MMGSLKEVEAEAEIQVDVEVDVEYLEKAVLVDEDD